MPAQREPGSARSALQHKRTQPFAAIHPLLAAQGQSLRAESSEACPEIISQKLRALTAMLYLTSAVSLARHSLLTVPGSDL